MKNLKDVLLCGVLLLSAATILAQGDTRFGIRAGVNMANVNAEDLDSESRIGLVFGVLVDIPKSEKFSIQPELQLSSKGFKVSQGNNKIVSKVSYLEIPIHAKFAFSKSEDLSIFGLAGPSFAFGVAGKFKVCDDDECGEEDIEFGEDGLKRFDAGLSLGAGVLVKNSIMVDLRYIIGLINIAGEDNSKNAAFQVGLGYMF